MGDPLKHLEERLEQLVPRGLSDHGRERLNEQIETLAQEVGESNRPGGRGPLVVGLAAAVAAMAGAAIFSVTRPDAPAPLVNEESATPGETASPEAGPGFEVVNFERTVGDAEDGGIVLDRFDEPMRSWNYDVREMELVLDPKSGLQVRIVQERREEVRVAVTSF